MEEDEEEEEEESVGAWRGSGKKKAQKLITAPAFHPLHPPSFPFPTRAPPAAAVIPSEYFIALIVDISTLPFLNDLLQV